MVKELLRLLGEEMATEAHRMVCPAPTQLAATARCRHRHRHGRSGAASSALYHLRAPLGSASDRRLHRDRRGPGDPTPQIGRVRANPRRRPRSRLLKVRQYTGKTRPARRSGGGHRPISSTGPHRGSPSTSTIRERNSRHLGGCHGGRPNSADRRRTGSAPPLSRSRGNRQ